MSDHEHAVCCCGSLRIRFLDLIHIHLEIDLLYPIFNAPFVRCHLGSQKDLPTLARKALVSSQLNRIQATKWRRASSVCLPTPF